MPSILSYTIYLALNQLRTEAKVLILILLFTFATILNVITCPMDTFEVLNKKKKQSKHLALSLDTEVERTFPLLPGELGDSRRAHFNALTLFMMEKT